MPDSRSHSVSRITAPHPAPLAMARRDDRRWRRRCRRRSASEERPLVASGWVACRILITSDLRIPELLLQEILRCQYNLTGASLQQFLWPLSPGCLSNGVGRGLVTAQPELGAAAEATV